MLVWKAISSMVLMMVVTSREACWISSIAVRMAWIWPSPSEADSREALATSWAWEELSALRLVIEESSSSEAELSSIEAACSLAPSARVWLAAETCPAAAAVWVAPAPRWSLISTRGLEILRWMMSARPAPRMTAATPTQTTADWVCTMSATSRSPVVVVWPRRVCSRALTSASILSPNLARSTARTWMREGSSPETTFWSCSPSP